jgi:hypothetical protein
MGAEIIVYFGSTLAIDKERYSVYFAPKECIHVAATWKDFVKLANLIRGRS